MQEVLRQPASQGKPAAADNQCVQLSMNEPTGDWWILWQRDEAEQAEHVSQNTHGQFRQEFMALDPETFPAPMRSTAKALRAIIERLSI